MLSIILSRHLFIIGILQPQYLSPRETMSNVSLSDIDFFLHRFLQLYVSSVAREASKVVSIFIVIHLSSTLKESDGVSFLRIGLKSTVLVIGKLPLGLI